jgi:uncharacterized protein involved in exopolysaccharide biosynthesis
MARIEEATLFRPDPKLQYPGQRPGGGGGGGGGGGSGRGGGGGDEDDGPNIAVRERVSEAARSARRRLGLSFMVVMICGALTVLAAIFAPRTYGVDARVLVRRTNAITGTAAPQWVSPEEQRAHQREFEEQVMARDNIIAIVKNQKLVERWDDMRQPHRRLIDKINQRLGKSAASDEEKSEALVNNIDGRLKVYMDGATVSLRLDWSEPVSARDIVDAAVKNFLEARYQSEVDPTRLRIAEGQVAAAHKELETIARTLVQLQKANDPNRRVNLIIPALPQGLKDRPGPSPDADPVLKAELEQVRGQIAVLQEAKLRRVTELNQQLIEKKQTLAEAHPEIIALKQTLAATQQDTPDLAAVRAKERDILNQIGAKQAAHPAAAKKEAPRAVAPIAVPTAAPVEKPLEVMAMGPSSVQDAQVQFESASARYQEAVKKLQESQLEKQTAEAAYSARYKVVHPAEVPAGPKRPVGLIAVVLGLLATIAAVLAAATLADRFSGIFFEPRDVRDRLGLPVFATFS